MTTIGDEVAMQQVPGAIYYTRKPLLTKVVALFSTEHFGFMSSEREGPPAGNVRHQEHLPVRTVRIPHSSSYDVGDMHKKEYSYQPQQQGYSNEQYRGSYGPPVTHQQQQRQQHSYNGYPHPNKRNTQNRIRPVVTDGSFGNSFEDERDDFSGLARDPRYASHGNQDYYRQQRSPTVESRYPDEGQDAREAAEQHHRREQPYHGQPEAGYASVNPAMVPPSPSSKRSIDEMTSQDSSEMSTSGDPSFKAPLDKNIKRNFFHHSKPDDKKLAPLPPAFMPPKKAKIGKGSPPKQEKYITPRQSVHSQQGFFNRAHSWGPQDVGYGHPQQQMRRQGSFPESSLWNDGQMDLSQGYYGGDQREQQEYSRDQPSPHSAFRPSHRDSAQRQQSYYPPNRDDSFQSEVGGNWRGSHETSWAQMRQSPHNQPGISPSWSGSIGQSSRQHQRDATSARVQQPELHTVDSSMSRQVTFESHGDSDGYHRRGYDKTGQQRHPQYPPPASPNSQQQRSPYGTESSQKRFFNTLPPVMEQDQREVIREGSVQLLAQPQDRIALSETLCVIRENIEVFVANVKDVEAPAPGRKHPVVVGQVGLRCIHCSHAKKHSDKVKRATCYPSSIKRIYRTVIDMKLDHFCHCPFVPLHLKQRLEELKATNTRSTGTTMQYFVRSAKSMGMVDAEGASGVRLLPQPEPEVEQKESTESMTFASVDPPPAGFAPSSFEEREPEANGGSFDSRAHSPEESRDQSLSAPSTSSMDTEIQQFDSNEEIPEFTGIASLSLPEDKMSLSPLRCFLRQNVCAFSATEEDIAVRTPTTFSVVVGQVGIGCIHCLKLPAKERSNRAVCFPFSIGRIYQSVADIQRFHFTECKMVPQEVRDRFVKLQSKSSKGSKGLATRQYWVSSAKKIGLVDTSKGIRFGRDPAVPSAPAVSLDILAQVASNATTVNRPLVLPEDKGKIAEFLFVVMQQLQPCRFTEADRNKRRLKNVGCIGVECKHCAGQVESRKFFWSSVNAVESNFVSVHTHMMECQHVPQPLKDHLAQLKAVRKEQTTNLKPGSQKAFFARVWERLHTEPSESDAEASAEEVAAPAVAEQVDTVSDKMAVVSV